MPDATERSRRSREAARRREAAAVLRVVAATADYASRQLADGLSPAQARVAALESADALESAARAVRRAVRWRPGERRAMAGLLRSNGVPTGEIAAQLGVCKRTARAYGQRGRG